MLLKTGFAIFKRWTKREKEFPGYWISHSPTYIQTTKFKAGLEFSVVISRHSNDPNFLKLSLSFSKKLRPVLSAWL